MARLIECILVYANWLNINFRRAVRITEKSVIEEVLPVKKGWVIRKETITPAKIANNCIIGGSKQMARNIYNQMRKFRLRAEFGEQINCSYKNHHQQHGVRISEVWISEIWINEVQINKTQINEVPINEVWINEVEINEVRISEVGISDLNLNYDSCSIR